LRQSEVLDRPAKALTNGLYPNKVLQEREIAGIYFLARYGKDFLKDLYQNIPRGFVLIIKSLLC
jgi:uncharacterized protein YllA (UPF0747 family)